MDKDEIVKMERKKERLTTKNVSRRTNGENLISTITTIYLEKKIERAMHATPSIFFV